MENLELSQEVVGQIGTLKDLSTQPITTAEQFAVAGEAVLKIASTKNKVVEFFKDMKEAAHKTHKSICDKESSYTKQLDEIRGNFTREMGSYQAEVDRKNAEEQERLRIENEKRIAEEKARLTALAEKQLEDGNKKAELLGQELSVMKARMIELQTMLQKSRETGEVLPDEIKIEYINLPKLIAIKQSQVQNVQEKTLEKVDNTLEKAQYVSYSTPIVNRTVETPKVPGLSMKESWEVVVDNPKLVPSYFEDVEIRTINQGTLNKLINQKNGVCNIPGCHAVKKYGTMARTGTR